jgi:antitoxin component YwqK of YwqJK toxin-antitoxin module
MQKLLLLLILSFFSTQGFTASCPDGNEPTKTVSDDGSYFVYKCGLSVLDAPKAEFYQRQYDMNSEVDQILSNRKTINPFLAWNYRKALSYNYYGIAWTNGWGKNSRLFSNSMFELESPDWNYYYPNGPWSFWKDHTKQKTFVTNINWDHGAEYGVTKAMNITDPKFPKAFAEEAHAISDKGFHGVMLDWWHIHHPIPWRGTTLENTMILITDEIRKHLGGDFLLMGNTNWRKNPNLVSSLNGVFSELYKTPFSRSDSFTFAEIAEMEELIKFNEKHLRYPKLIAFEPWRITDKSDPTNRTSEDNLRFARLYSAMATVIPEHGYILYGDNNPDFDEGDHDHHYYDVYSVDLGKPESKYTPIAQGVAYKKFEKGYIAYNRHEYDLTVNFGDFEVVIPSMDAVFLNDDGSLYQYSCEEGFILNNGTCLDNGLITFRYEKGEIKSEENYKDGMLDGKKTAWYQNGEIKSEENYKDGKKEGKYSTWYENSQINIETTYEDDKKNGKYTEWYKNGQIKAEKSYKDGKKEGKYSTWYENGQIKSEENYTNGKLDGEKTVWNENGQIMNNEMDLIMSSFSFDEIIQQ